jgi:hypothetical protein
VAMWVRPADIATSLPTPWRCPGRAVGVSRTYRVISGLSTRRSFLSLCRASTTAT